jgi:hypothetical protein
MADRGHRLAVGVLEGLGKWLWGFEPRLMHSIVTELGPVRSLAWFVANMPRYEITRRMLGPLRTNLAGTVISLYNGCRYCAFGQGYAVELIYLKERDRVFPVSADEMSTWIGLPPAELRNRLFGVLERADLHGEMIWVDRTLAQVRGEQRPVDRHEARIPHLIRMFAMLNGVANANDTEPDEAHDPINKNRALKARNAALRGSRA